MQPYTNERTYKKLYKNGGVGQRAKPAKMAKKVSHKKARQQFKKGGLDQC